MPSRSQQTPTHDAGGTVNSRPALGVFAGRVLDAVRTLWRTFWPVGQWASWLVGSLFFVTPALAQMTPAGTQIRNVGAVTYTAPGGAATTVNSNPVTAIVAPPPSLSTLAILRATTAGGTTDTTAGPTQCRASNGYSPLPNPVLTGGTVVDPTKPVTLTNTTTLHGGEAVFVQVSDADRNGDAQAIDTVDIELSTPAGDREQLRLSETGVNTGVFVGYVQTRAAAVNPGDCVLEVARNAIINSTYVDPTDTHDTSRANALVDPYGLVFDSRTGTPINGTRVRLVDVATGMNAVVYGDDGVSSYPAEMITGSAVTDAGGTLYTLPAGVFRFPLVMPGNYRLEIVPPPGHVFPSTLSVTELSTTPGAPYRISAGSFGNAFTATTPPAVAIDLPLDAGSTQLFMQKTTQTTVASVGDFVQYALRIQNTSGNAAIAGVRAVDTLPAGLRYRPGSTRIGSAAAADPQISADGRTLTFTTGVIAAGASIEIRYVVEVTVGARGKQIVNHAQALGPDGVASNQAQATIQLKEELFRDRAFIVGRVVEGDCKTPVNQLQGVPNVRVYLEDGRYSNTDEDGKYHFDDVVPGSHVVQMDTVTVPQSHQPLFCSDRVRNAGRAYSQFVDVRSGALWRADFVVERREAPRGAVTLQLDTSLAGGAGLHHTLAMFARALPISNARVLVMLPEGLALEPGSVMLGTQSIADPAVVSGVMSVSVGALGGDSGAVLTFNTKLAPKVTGGMVVKAVASFDTPAQKSQTTAPVENTLLRGEMMYESAAYRFAPKFDVLDTRIQANDRTALAKIVAEWRGVTNLTLKATGHTDSQLIAARNRTVFPDNYALSYARAQAVANYLSESLGIDQSRVSIEGRGADQPLAQGHDARSMALNRRVEISIDGLRVVAAGGLTVKNGTARSPEAVTHGTFDPIAPPPPRHTRRIDNSGKAASIDVETLAPKVDWLLPVPDDVPAIPAIKVAIAHLASQTVELAINGAPVSPLNFDGAERNQSKTVALSRWRGVDLSEGDNQLVAIVRDDQGAEVSRMTRTVHYSGGAVRAELVREASTLTADGRTRPVVALRMIDASGKPARPGTLAAFSIDAPYRSWFEVETLDDNKLVTVAEREPTFTVDDDGLARLELEPTTQAGTAVIRVRFNERQRQEIRVWLEPQARDWILVGLAEGTAAYKSVADNMQSAADAGLEEGYENDGRVAFFAKGAIKGEYLLTMAYDSAREHEQVKDKLLGVVEPDRFYTLYGDATEQRFEAATSRKIFLKLERRQFAALFGDFETGLTVTELARYSRTFTGFKTDYAGERFGYTAFAAQSDQGYVKDQLQGDGTSGLYRLSHRPLIINSDKIRIETRDRFRSEVVVESRELTRYIDYSIDYLNGTLFFKQPIASRDQAFNPQYIVAEYEVLNGGKEQITGGGRGAVKFADDRVELGASFLNEGAAAGDTRIAGTDLRWQLAPATLLKAEVAHSESDDPTATAEDAGAYLVELTHLTEKLDAHVYAREQETGFGVGQQFASEAGTRKMGIDGRYHVSEKLIVEGETYRQEVLGTGAARDLASAELRQQADDYTLGGGARYVSDTGLTSGDAKSEQAFVNGSVDLFNDRVTLRASQDVSLGDSASTDFPARSVIGADYHFRADTTFFTEFEHANGTDFTADMTRVGVRTAPWQHALVQSSMNQQSTEYGPRVFANVGLTQGWQATDKLALDFGVDQSHTVKGPNVAPLNANTPFASGGSLVNTTTGGGAIGTVNSSINNPLGTDFFATYVGAAYESETWTVTSRLENRTADEEDRWVFAGGFYREPLAGHAFSLTTQWFDSDFATGTDTMAGDIQFAWAFRPATSEWIMLERLDLRHEARKDTNQKFESSKLINNFNSNWQLDNRTQLGLQFGARYVSSTFDGERYRGVSTLYGVDFRHDLTERFDIGVHGTMLQSLESKVSDQSVGIDVGVTLVKNVWISIGYNFAGFSDDDFDASRYTAQGPFLKFRVKADQDTFKDLSLESLRPSKR
jgi:uncharacterized repeat protein (TIGR01451 family)